MNHIEHGWKAYEQMFLQGAPDAVRQHIRTAFFAGSSSMFLSLVARSLNPTPADSKLILDIQREVLEFSASWDAAIAREVLGNIKHVGEA